MHSAMKWLALGAMGCGFNVHGDGDVQTRTVKVGAFDGVFNGSFLDVTLQEGPPGKVQVTCDANLLDLMAVEVVQDELRIHKTIMGGMQPTRSCFAVVNVPADHELTSLRNAGSGRFETELTLPLGQIRNSGSGNVLLGDIASREVDLVVSGSGDVEIQDVTGDLFVDSNGSGDVQVDRLVGDLVSDQGGSGDVWIGEVEGRHLDGRLRGSGDLEASGLVDRVDVHGGGSGSFFLDGLETLTADVRLTGSGDARLWVLEEVTGQLGGSGSLFLFGGPDFVDVRTTGSGDVVLHSER